MALQGILQKLFQRFSAQRATGIFEEFVAYILVQPYDFEELAIPITSDRANAHSSEHFSEADIDGFAISSCTFRLCAFGKPQCEIRTNSAGPRRDEHRDVMS